MNSERRTEKNYESISIIEETLLCCEHPFTPSSITLRGPPTLSSIPSQYFCCEEFLLLRITYRERPQPLSRCRSTLCALPGKLFLQDDGLASCPLSRLKPSLRMLTFRGGGCALIDMIAESQLLFLLRHYLALRITGHNPTQNRRISSMVAHRGHHWPCTPARASADLPRIPFNLGRHQWLRETPSWLGLHETSSTRPQTEPNFGQRTERCIRTVHT